VLSLHDTVFKPESGSDLNDGANMKHLYFFILVLPLFTACARLPEFDRVYSYALPDTVDTTYSQMVAKQQREHPGQSAFYLLNNGLDAFVARAVTAQYAEKSLDIQYYIYRKDMVGELISYELSRAADRGVRVRLLLDDINAGEWDRDLLELNAHPQIEVRLFNPFNRQSGRLQQLFTHEHAITRRMHNKSFTADNQITIVGGRNIGNEYFQANPEISFADLDVMGFGPVAKEVSTSFDQYWNSELSYPIDVLVEDKRSAAEMDAAKREFYADMEKYRNSEYDIALMNSDLYTKMKNDGVKLFWGDADVLYDSPDKILSDLSETKYNLTPQLQPYLEGIEKELLIFSPYFVPGKSGVIFLTDLVKRGVRVAILTNSLASNDVGIVHSGYAKYRKALLEGGVELYELNKKLMANEKKERKRHAGGLSQASLHAKAFVFDRKNVFIGSLNLDPRSVVHNTEIGVIIKSEEMATLMAKNFDSDMDRYAFRLELKDHKIFWHGMVDGQEKTFDVEPYTSFWERFGVKLMSLLPIEDQL